VLNESIELSHQKKLLKMAENKTETLAGYLPLLVGMPLVLRKTNLAAPLGICNGSRGELVGVVLHPKEPDTPQWEAGQTDPVLHQLKYQPKALLVRFDECHIDKALFPELSSDPKVVIITRQKADFEYAYKEKAKQKFQREQFPLQPGYARTLHTAQGETITDGMISDVNIDFNCPNGVYVLLSRPTKGNGLALLTAFDAKKALCKAPPWSLLNEQTRLDRIAEKTMQPFLDRLPKLRENFSKYLDARQAMMSRFVDKHGPPPSADEDDRQLEQRKGKGRKRRAADDYEQPSAKKKPRTGAQLMQQPGDPSPAVSVDGREEPALPNTRQADSVEQLDGGRKRKTAPSSDIAGSASKRQRICSGKCGGFIVHVSKRHCTQSLHATTRRSAKNGIARAVAGPGRAQQLEGRR
jgi:hypothetical protein